MTALAKLADQIAIARQTGTFVVLTPDEAAAILAEVGETARAVLRRGLAPPAEAARKPEAWIAYPASGKALTFYPERAARWREIGDRVVALYTGPDEA